MTREELKKFVEAELDDVRAEIYANIAVPPPKQVAESLDARHDYLVRLLHEIPTISEELVEKAYTSYMTLKAFSF